MEAHAKCKSWEQGQTCLPSLQITSYQEAKKTKLQSNLFEGICSCSLREVSQLFCIGTGRQDRANTSSDAVSWWTLGVDHWWFDSGNSFFPRSSYHSQSLMVLGTAGVYLGRTPQGSYSTWRIPRSDLPQISAPWDWQYTDKKSWWSLCWRILPQKSSKALLKSALIRQNRFTRTWGCITVYFTFYSILK